MFAALADPMPEPIVSGACRPTSAAVADATHRADAGGTARYARALGGFQGEEAWRAADFRVGHAPLVAGNRVLAPRERALAALDRESGEVLWETASPGGRISGRGLVAAGGAVFAAWTGHLAAYDSEAGAECWRLPVSPVSSPAFADGLVFVRVAEGESGSTAAIDAVTGQIRWRARGTHPSSGLDRSELAIGDGMLFVSDGPDVVALDLRTGAPRWRAATGTFVGAGLTYANGVVYAPDVGRGLYAFEAGTGNVNWTWRDPQGGNLHGSLALSDELVYAVDERHLHAIGRESGTEAWRADGARLDKFHSPILAGDRVYTITQDGALVVFDAHAGTELARVRVAGPRTFGSAVPAPGEQRLYFIGRDSTLHAVR
jgi:outer membrane protein assembly factor BamB